MFGKPYTIESFVVRDVGSHLSRCHSPRLQHHISAGTQAGHVLVCYVATSTHVGFCKPPVAQIFSVQTMLRQELS